MRSSILAIWRYGFLTALWAFSNVDSSYVLHFDGRDDVLHVPHVAGLSPHAVTVEAWVRASEHKSYNWVVGRTEFHGGWVLFLDKAAKAGFGLFINGSMRAISSRTLQRPGTWHHIAGRYDGRVMTVYVDGEAGDDVPTSAPVGLSTVGGITIGGSTRWPRLHFDGQLAHVVLWSVARSQEEIAQGMVRAWRGGQNIRPGAKHQGKEPGTPHQCGGGKGMSDGMAGTGAVPRPDDDGVGGASPTERMSDEGVAAPQTGPTTTSASDDVPRTCDDVVDEGAPPRWMKWASDGGVWDASAVTDAVAAGLLGCWPLDGLVPMLPLPTSPQSPSATPPRGPATPAEQGGTGGGAAGSISSGAATPRLDGGGATTQGLPQAPEDCVWRARASSAPPTSPYGQQAAVADAAAQLPKAVLSSVPLYLLVSARGAGGEADVPETSNGEGTGTGGGSETGDPHAHAFNVTMLPGGVAEEEDMPAGFPDEESEEAAPTRSRAHKTVHCCVVMWTSRPAVEGNEGEPEVTGAVDPEGASAAVNAKEEAASHEGEGEVGTGRIELEVGSLPHASIGSLWEVAASVATVRAPEELSDGLGRMPTERSCDSSHGVDVSCLDRGDMKTGVTPGGEGAREGDEPVPISQTPWRVQPGRGVCFSPARVMGPTRPSDLFLPYLCSADGHRSDQRTAGSPSPEKKESSSSSSSPEGASREKGGLFSGGVCAKGGCGPGSAATAGCDVACGQFSMRRWRARHDDPRQAGDGDDTNGSEGRGHVNGSERDNGKTCSSVLGALRACKRRRMEAASTRRRLVPAVRVKWADIISPINQGAGADPPHPMGDSGEAPSPSRHDGPEDPRAPAAIVETTHHVDHIGHVDQVDHFDHVDHVDHLHDKGHVEKSRPLLSALVPFVGPLAVTSLWQGALQPFLGHSWSVAQGRGACGQDASTRQDVDKPEEDLDVVPEGGKEDEAPRITGCPATGTRLPLGRRFVEILIAFEWEHREQGAWREMVEWLYREVPCGGRKPLGETAAKHKPRFWWPWHAHYPASLGCHVRVRAVPMAPDATVITALNAAAARAHATWLLPLEPRGVAGMCYVRALVRAISQQETYRAEATIERPAPADRGTPRLYTVFAPGPSAKGAVSAGIPIRGLDGLAADCDDAPHAHEAAVGCSRGRGCESMADCPRSIRWASFPRPSPLVMMCTSAVAASKCRKRNDGRLTTVVLTVLHHDHIMLLDGCQGLPLVRILYGACSCNKRLAAIFQPDPCMRWERRHQSPRTNITSKPGANYWI
eukprot:jgi/Mesvir1/19174/Mv01193-RA.1